MSMWQFMAAVEGYQQAHAPDRRNSLSEQEADELWAMIEANP